MSSEWWKEKKGRWSELAEELWEEIGKRMESDVDIQMFRSTCKSWRSLLPSPFPSVFPMDVPPLSGYCEFKPFWLVEQTGYLIADESDNPPFLVVFQAKPGGTMDRPLFSPLRLFNPRLINPVPDESRLSLDLHQLRRISYIFKNYNLHLPYIPQETGVSSKDSLANKLVLLSYDNQDVTLTFVALLPNGSLAKWTVNTMEWRSVSQRHSNFDDIINYRGKLWGVDFDGGAFVMDENHSSSIMTQVAASPIIFSDGGNTFVWDRKTSKLTPLISPYYSAKFKDDRNGVSCYDHTSRLKGRKRLVETPKGELYMLFPCRRNDGQCDSSLPSNQIKVFKLVNSKKDNDKYEWLEVESIGNDMAFFVTHQTSFCIGRLELGLDESNGNCIFLNSASFSRSYLSQTRDIPLFSSTKPCPTTTGVYRIADKQFNVVTPLNYPQICYTDLPFLKEDHSAQIRDFSEILRFLAEFAKEQEQSHNSD